MNTLQTNRNRNLTLGILLGLLTLNLFSLETFANPGKVMAKTEFKVNFKDASILAQKHGFKFSVLNQQTSSKHSLIGDVVCMHPTTRINCSGMSQMLLPGASSGTTSGSISINKAVRERFACKDLSSDKAVGCSATFYFFKDKNLSPGWSLKSVKVRGGKWQKVSRNQNGAFMIVLKDGTGVNGKKAYVDSVTLVGPSNGNWQDAFNGNYRRSPAVGSR